MDFLPRAKLLMRKEWQEIWNCCDGNKLLMLLIPQWVLPNRMILSVRRDAVILNRLQIGHTRAIHTHIFLVMTKLSVLHVIGLLH